MGTDCGDIVSDEVLWELSEANKEAKEWAENGTLDRLWEEYAKEMPVIEAKLEADGIRCLQENVESGLRALSELSQSGAELTHLQLLDLKVRPTEEQCHIQHDVGIKLSRESNQKNSTLRFDFSENAIVNFPTIYGTKPVSPEVIEEVMRTLINLKQDRGSWDVGRVNGVMLVDYKIAQDFPKLLGAGGYVHPADVLRESQQSPVSLDVRLDEETAKEIGLSHTPETGKYETKEILPIILHIVLGPDGRPLLAANREQKENEAPTPEKYVPHGKVWEWTIAHELQHLGYHHKIGEVRELDRMGHVGKVFAENKDAWERAKATQLQKGPVDDPGMYEKMKKEGYSKEAIEEEFRNQHIAAWETDSPLLCPEMKEFFNERLAEK